MPLASNVLVDDGAKPAQPALHIVHGFQDAKEGLI
jgi:hypothetical protein